MQELTERMKRFAELKNVSPEELYAYILELEIILDSDDASKKI